MFVMLMSQCDSDTRSQVESATKYLDLEKKLNSMGLLAVIKKLV